MTYYNHGYGRKKNSFKYIYISAFSLIAGLGIGFFSAAYLLKTRTARMSDISAEKPKAAELPPAQSNARLYLKIASDAIITCVGRHPTAFFIRDGIVQSMPAASFMQEHKDGERDRIAVSFTNDSGKIELSSASLTTACEPTEGSFGR